MTLTEPLSAEEAEAIKIPQCIPAKKISQEKPDFAMQCVDCGCEFVIKSTYFEIDNEKCPECGSSQLKELYVSYPLDGPGFQEDYSVENIAGGCEHMADAQVSCA